MILDLNNDVERAQCLQNMLVLHATDGTASNQDYKFLRSYFMEQRQTRDILPSFVKVNRDLAQFWQYIKYEFKTYAERRNFIYREFTPLLDFLDGKGSTPADTFISDTLKDFDEDSVHSAWQRALDRKKTDPEGAITSARTLLETVCKHILDRRDIEYDSSKIELHELYKLTANELNLSQHQHIEVIFKQILNGCSAVVNGLGTLRNKLGDAHGRGTTKVKPATRHAELAVNLAGSVSLFLVATYNTQENQEI